MQVPTLRDRVFNLLNTARTVGRVGVDLEALANVLGATPEEILSATLSDMLEGMSPALHCMPREGGPMLIQRS